MKRPLSKDEQQILILARTVLNLAKQKMSPLDVEDDKRCRYARKLIKELTRDALYCTRCGALLHSLPECSCLKP